MSESVVIAQIRSHNMKVTKYRVGVLNILYAYTHPLSAAEILTYLSQSDLQPNKTTVYRELDFLVASGLVLALDLGDDRKRYELADREHHHHLVCQRCNRIEDVVIDEDVKEIERKIKRSRNFKVLDHTMEFFGLCQGCQ
jgi:Fur family ferric uptake transcriptional regulator